MTEIRATPSISKFAQRKINTISDPATGFRVDPEQEEMPPNFRDFYDHAQNFMDEKEKAENHFFNLQASIARQTAFLVKKARREVRLSEETATPVSQSTKAASPIGPSPLLTRKFSEQRRDKAKFESLRQAYFKH